MTAERRFAEFQRTRDPGCLGHVFDLCADDLFAVALHLCRDRATAEDALQSTFVVAIERAHRWRADRPLRPWLLGILHREVRAQQRRDRRQPRQDRLAHSDVPDPQQLVGDAETETVVRGAIAALPEPYRAVVQLRLMQALDHDAIAVQLQRSPGTVRTQLWRGIELLRQSLPKSLAIGLAAHVLGRPALAAVRAQVVAAAGNAVATSGVGILGGAIVSKVILCAMALVATWVLLAVNANGEPSFDATPARGDGAAALAARARDAQPSVVAPSTKPAENDLGVVRTPVATTAPAAALQSVDLFVVDGKGDPVVGAVVQVFAAVLHGRDPRRSAGKPLQVLATDAQGRCPVPLAEECMVAAHKEGIGMSGDWRLDPERRMPEGVRLQLLPSVRVFGTVLNKDGTKAVGARVECWSNGHIAGGQAAAPPDPVTGPDGAFAVEFVPPASYVLRSGGAIAEIDTSRGERIREVTLQQLGAFSVRGRLLTSDNQPLAGEVVLSRAGVHAARAQTEADGAFLLELDRGGRLDLIAAAPTRTAAHEVIVLDAEQPHRDLTLRLLPLAEVRGRVVDERGAPLGGTFLGVFVSPTDPWQLGGYASLPRGPVAADGTFCWQLPQVMLRIACRPVPGVAEMWTEGVEFVPPTSDLRVVVSDADRVDRHRGFELLGQVVAAATSAPVPKVRVEMTVRNENGARSRDVACRLGAYGTFALAPVHERGALTFRFEAEGLAPVVVGPLEWGERQEHVLVQLPAFAQLTVQVLRADGRPAPQARVSLRSEALEPFGPTWSLKTDADGRARFAEVWPRAWTLRAWMQRDRSDGIEQDVSLHAGDNGLVQIRLSR